MGRFGLALVLALLGPLPAPAAAPWVPPVDGPVVRPFEEPATGWAPGHRGVDFAVAPGTEVRAAAGGRVVFAGRVAEALHVVVAHPGDVRSSYSHLSTVAVAEGAGVERGDVLGRSGGAGPGHDGTVVHFGVRLGERYVDPAPFLARPSLRPALAPDRDTVRGGRPEPCWPREDPEPRRLHWRQPGRLTVLASREYARPQPHR